MEPTIADHILIDLVTTLGLNYINPENQTLNIIIGAIIGATLPLLIFGK